MKNLLPEPAVEEIVSALGRKDMPVREHPERVAVIAQRKYVRVRLVDCCMRLGIDVPNSIRFKPAKLNADEVHIMRTYPYLGYEGVRFVAVACAFDTFVSDRPHDSVRGLAFAREETSRGSGVSFDPGIVAGFWSLPGGRFLGFLVAVGRCVSVCY